MRSRFLMFLPALFLMGFPAIAQEEPEPLPAADSAEPAAAPAPAFHVEAGPALLVAPAVQADIAPPSLKHVAKKSLSDWDAVMWLGTVAALINGLLRLLKMSPVEGMLETRDLKWVKPALSCALGAVMGALGAFEMGTPVGIGAVGGALAGLTGVGGHEILNPRRVKTAKDPEPAPATPAA